MSTDDFIPFPIGVRQNNPLNIDAVKEIVWNGAVYPAQNRYETFKSPMWGIRAACCIIHNYGERYNARTLATIIARWAPPSENPTVTYIDFVAARMGRSTSCDIGTQDDYAFLLRAMAVFENGFPPYSPDLWLRTVNWVFQEEKWTT